jgi:hypothetical protein
MIEHDERTRRFPEKPGGIKAEDVTVPKVVEIANLPPSPPGRGEKDD